MKSFHGAVEVNVTTAKARLLHITEEVISVLTSDPIAKITGTSRSQRSVPARSGGASAPGGE
jgi:hypothetical protein